MRIGLKKRNRIKRRARGICPDRPTPVFSRISSETNCVQCGVTIDYVKSVDGGEPVTVVACPQCGIVFNTETKNVLLPPYFK